MLSFGLSFIAVNVLYILFSVLMGFIAYKLYKLKKVGFIVFLIVLLLPYYDLFIQKGIKTYYETFKMNNTIYAYPERDKDGKIESLGVWRSARHPTSSYLWNQESLENFRKQLSGVSKFVEFYFVDSFEKMTDENGKEIIKDNYGRKGDLGYARVYLNESPIHYEKIKDESEYQARYQVKGIDDSGIFYRKTIIEFWDTKEKKLLATSFGLYFRIKSENDKFRNKYLLWRGPSGVAFAIDSFSSNKNLYYKLFHVIY